MSHVTAFIIGIGIDVNESEESSGTSRTGASCDFSTPVLHVRGRRVSTSTSLRFATFAILDTHFPKSMPAGRE